MRKFQVFSVIALSSLSLILAGCTSSSSDSDDSAENISDDPALGEDVLDPTAPTTAGTISNFLWKPEAESLYNKGNPVIHSNPCALTFVNGALVQEYGPGNGRCNTARLFKRCGSFPANTKVEIIDEQSGLPYTDPNTGLPYVLIANPCARQEFL